MKFRKYLMVGIVAAAVSTTAACGSDSSNDLPVVTSATSSAAAAPGSTSLDDQMTNSKQRPSVEALNDMLQQALDPKIPPKDKIKLVEGSEADPDLFNQLVKAKEENPDVTYKIKKPVVGNGPGKASVKVEVKLPDNPPTKIDASIVYDNGRWKLSKDTVCTLLTAYDVKTVLCTDSSDKSGSAKSESSKSSKSDSGAADSTDETTTKKKPAASESAGE